jgi:UDP-glucose 6-dehydrogenase
MDVMDMSDFKQGEFNVIVDKGTLDSVLCGDNSEPNAIKMLSEVYRVLTSNGIYICITYGDEEHRLKYFVKFFLIRKILNGR